MDQVRITVAVAKVLRAFLADPNESRYGYDLMRELRFPSGKLYPILNRLLKAGWIARLDPVDGAASVSGGPPRVPYRLTAEGVVAARQELAQLSEAVRPNASGILKPRPGGGPW